MLFTHVLMAGGAIYVGTKAYQKVFPEIVWYGFDIPPRKQEGSLRTLYAQGKAALSEWRTDLWARFNDAMYLGGPLGVLNYRSIAERRGSLIKIKDKNKDGRAF